MGGVELTEDNYRQLWVPPGFAHGFYVLSDTADFLYKTTDYYFPDLERSLLWNDPQLLFHGRLKPMFHLSFREKIKLPPKLTDAELFD